MTLPQYNGQANKPTWLVDSWLSNEFLAHAFWSERAAELRDCPNGLGTLANEMKASAEDNNPLAEDASMYSDMLSFALAWVEWVEVADSFMSV